MIQMLITASTNIFLRNAKMHNDFWQSAAEFSLFANGRCHLEFRKTSSCLAALYVIMALPTAKSLRVYERGIIRAENESNVIIIR